MKKLVVIDGQGGGMGRQLIETLLRARPETRVLAIGTNAMATATMIKAGAAVGATGENAVRVTVRDADIVAGPIGIVLADALMGEVTPDMAAAIGACPAVKVLLPVARCRVLVAGCEQRPLSALLDAAVTDILALLDGA